MDFTQIDITQIVTAVIGLLSALISAFLIPWIKSKIDDEKLQQADAIITIAVGAAEQLFKSTEGQLKKQYVLDYLKKKGITLDAATIEVMIENAVILLHNELYGSKRDEPVVVEEAPKATKKSKKTAA